MFALVAAVLLFFVAIGVRHLGPVDLFTLALAFWALHFAYGVGVPLWRRRRA